MCKCLWVSTDLRKTSFRDHLQKFFVCSMAEFCLNHWIQLKAHHESFLNRKSKEVVVIKLQFLSSFRQNFFSAWQSRANKKEEKRGSLEQLCNLSKKSLSAVIELRNSFLFVNRATSTLLVFLNWLHSSIAKQTMKRKPANQIGLQWRRRWCWVWRGRR